jgi:predicted DNA-binding transcriptional regulator AlpA
VSTEADDEGIKQPSRSAYRALRNLPPEIALNQILVTAQAGPFCGYSPNRWRELARDGLAPPPMKVGPHRLGWRVADLIQWIESRKMVLGKLADVEDGAAPAPPQNQASCRPPRRHQRRSRRRRAQPQPEAA